MTNPRLQESYRFVRFIIIGLTLFSLTYSNIQFTKASNSDINSLHSTHLYQEKFFTQLYLPMVQKLSPNIPTINIPFFEGSEKNYHQAAVSWFGQVRGNENHANIRIGYNSEEIYVRVSTFDRFLWYDENPDLNNLTNWDAVTLYLDLDGNVGNELGPTMYRFIRQMQWWDDGQNRQVAYQGSPYGWEQKPLSFSTDYDWRGNAPNDSEEDRGHVITFHIPFTSLGYPRAPSLGTKWGAALTLHDRDDADGTTYDEKYWIQDFHESSSSSWGQFSFGLPDSTSPPAINPQEYIFREGLNGYHLTDGVVGGNTMCGEGLDFWFQWGDYNYSHIRYMNAQNQGNIDDWPCFSKFYITFPLESLPMGKKVISSTLTLHQIGQATGFPDDPPEALNSLIQVSIINDTWDEASLTWNNAPFPIENVSQSWVEFIEPDELGKAYDWDLRRAVTSAYLSGQPLRLVLYSADSYGPNGKYFFSSDEDWEIMRPSLQVVLGDR